MIFDPISIRNDFPILSRKFDKIPLIYFDNAATSQKPNVVIKAIETYYNSYNANIHRGVHTLSQEATNAYEAARRKVQSYTHAAKPSEVIFTYGTTHGINLIASGLSQHLKENDEIIISATEHHSNIVPWQMLCQRVGAKMRVIPMDTQGNLNMEAYASLLSPKTKLVACGHVSNTLGTVNPVSEIIEKAHLVGAAVLLDGAQATAHLEIDVQKLDVDFYVASGHKMCGPTGIGFLYGKEKWLDLLPPYQGGGEMIKSVTFEKTVYADLPHKFEAGTPNICGAIALGAAIDYINNLGLSHISEYEDTLLKHATELFSTIEGLEIYGTSKHKTAIVSFNLKGAHPYDVGSILDKMGIAVRTGHHCTQPIMDFYEIPGTVRASFMFYNTKNEIETMVEGLTKAKKMLG